MGVGSKLLEVAEEIANLKNAKGIILEVLDTNIKAKKFYFGKGFSFICQLMYKKI
jgi:ribosomal protein S18 acetylase RimI-like enzyme